jgi:hypothetical protein
MPIGEQSIGIMDLWTPIGYRKRFLAFFSQPCFVSLSCRSISIYKVEYITTLPVCRTVYPYCIHVGYFMVIIYITLTTVVQCCKNSIPLTFTKFKKKARKFMADELMSDELIDECNYKFTY